MPGGLEGRRRARNAAPMSLRTRIMAALPSATVLQSVLRNGAAMIGLRSGHRVAEVEVERTLDMGERIARAVGVVLGRDAGPAVAPWSPFLVEVLLRDGSEDAGKVQAVRALFLPVARTGQCFGHFGIADRCHLLGTHHQHHAGLARFDGLDTGMDGGGAPDAQAFSSRAAGLNRRPGCKPSARLDTKPSWTMPELKWPDVHRIDVGPAARRKSRSPASRTLQDQALEIVFIEPAEPGVAPAHDRCTAHVVSPLVDASDFREAGRPDLDSRNTTSG